MKKILTVLLFVAMYLPMQAGKLKESASQMLFRLNAELVKYQQTDVCDPDFGAIGCSGCSVYHTRAGEAMLPLAYEYFLTGSEDRLRQAVALAVRKSAENHLAFIYPDGTLDGSTGVRSKNMFRPSGGAMTLLWTEGYGLVQASSQTEYIRWEPLNFPEAADVRPLTPRLEYSIDSLYYTNLFDFDATISVRELKHCIEVRTTGSLKDRDGFWGGVMYAMEYIWDGKSMTKSCTIIHQTNDTPVYLIEPLLWDEGTTMEQTGQREIRLERNGVAISIKSKDHNLSLDMKQIPYYTQPYPSVRAVPLIVKSSPSDMGRDTVTLIYSLSAVDPTN